MTDPPFLVILGGINGAGKTTTAEQLARSPDLVGVPFLNPDKETAAILQREPALPRATAEYRGMRMVAEQMAVLLAERRSFVTETVLASAGYRRICTAAQQAGYRVLLYWVGVPTVEDSIRRVARRVAKGGHDVRELDIRRRWPLTHANLAWFALHADEVAVLANPSDVKVPRRIATVHAGIVTLLDPAALPEVTRVLAPLAAG